MRLDQMRAIGLAALGLAAVVALSACASGAASSPSASGSGSGGTEPATATDLVGVWVTGESYHSPKQPRLDVAADGTWTGSDGCNGTEGTWSVAADGSLSVTAGLSTLIGCDGADLPGMFSKAALAYLDGESLVLADADGAPVVTLVAEPADGASATPSTAGVLGTWSADAPQGTEVFLTFTDGKVTGKDGCNNLMGSWSASDGTTIVLSGLASTMMYCEGVDTWLAKAVGLTIEGDTAVVVDDSGAQIGTLHHQG